MTPAYLVLGALLAVGAWVATGVAVGWGVAAGRVVRLYRLDIPPEGVLALSRAAVRMLDTRDEVVDLLVGLLHVAPGYCATLRVCCRVAGPRRGFRLACALCWPFIVPMDAIFAAVLDRALLADAAPPIDAPVPWGLAWWDRRGRIRRRVGAEAARVFPARGRRGS